MLSGLLSAHYLAVALPGISSPGDNMYLTQATDLADRLLGTYESSSGVPFSSIYLSSRKGIPSHDGGASSTVEATTLQIEIK
jgi:mannosyl-oligosaccharide alpha-1,2-mannosidase